MTRKAIFDARSGAGLVRVRRLVCLAVAALALAACNGRVMPGGKDEGQTKIPEGNAFDLFYSCQQKLLVDLNDESARRDCETALLIQPDAGAEYNPRLLLDQLDVDPKLYLSEQRASVPSHRVRPGEDLSQIAARDLGNPFLFIALARHNCIDKPSGSSLEGRVIDLTGSGNCGNATVKVPSGSQFHRCGQLLQRDLNSLEARRLCERALESNPRHRGAASLLRQLDQDPAELLPGDSIEYAVQPGDSLGKLALTYLGDDLLFVALARYNGISNPSRLDVGQILRIPANAAVAPESPAESVNQTVVEKAEPSAIESAQADAVRLFNRGDFAGAIASLDGLSDEELTAEVVTMRTDARRQIRIRSKLDRAEQAEQTGDLWEAHSLYRDVLDEDPGNQNAHAKAGQLKALLLKDYEKQAAKSFSNQQYEDTVLVCDRIFELDPGNKLADYYKEQAVDLLNRLGE